MTDAEREAQIRQTGIAEHYLYLVIMDIYQPMLDDHRMPRPLPIGTSTQWGKIGGVGTTGMERYYWIIDSDGTVSMIPAFMVEPSHIQA